MFGSLLCICLLSLSSFLPSLAANAASTEIADTPPHLHTGIEQQRQLYRQLRSELARGNSENFHQGRQELADYPLLPYVEYSYLNSQLGTLPTSNISSFLEEQAGSYLAARLEREWTAMLARQQRWPELLRFHNPANSTTVLNCQVLLARLANGDQTALDEVAPLWNVSISQPNECDPLFNTWMEAGYLSPALNWERFSKVLQAGHRPLARYLAGLMPEREQQLAELYLLIDSQPQNLLNQSIFAAHSAETAEIILHGIRRLALRDAPQAMDVLLQQHRHEHFEESTLLNLQRFVLLRMLLQGYTEDSEALLAENPELADSTIVSWLLRNALQRQDWNSLDQWLTMLSAEEQQSERWRYWQARSLAQRGTGEAGAKALELYRSIAANRSYYGFLAADLLGLDYEMQNRPVTVNGNDITALYEIPAIVRAYELYQLGDEINAMNEWQHAMAGMNTNEIMSSGKLADSWGWYRNGIQAMIRASYWDDLQLRFPLAYSELFAQTAEQHALQTHFLFAVARQESAFISNARSPAGARGLMQLMPATARQMASAAGLRISTEDLYEPALNIRLGSDYLAYLLEDFQGNRILAAAAYNAGPNRVRQWLQRSSENPLPPDIWVETIPFAETRNYVQNVLAFAVIYAHRMEQESRLLTEQETYSQL